MSPKIPSEFYEGNRHPKARTVGELIAHLERLPKTLPVSQDFGKGALMVVMNAKNEHACLHFENGDLER